VVAASVPTRMIRTGNIPALASSYAVVVTSHRGGPGDGDSRRRSAVVDTRDVRAVLVPRARLASRRHERATVSGSCSTTAST
jgi:hypothetical protein